MTLIEEKENLLPSWDIFAGNQIWHTLSNQGVTIHLNAKIDLPSPQTCTARPMFNLQDGTLVSHDLTLVATGRKPNVEELGLESF